MIAITDYLAGVPLFLGYFATALVLTGIYTFIYTLLTPHDEMALIKENKPAASVAFTGSLIGFCSASGQCYRELHQPDRYGAMGICCSNRAGSNILCSAHCYA